MSAGPEPPLSCDLRLNHARFWLRELRVSQQISTFYGPSVQAMDTQLGARHQRWTPTIHRGRAPPSVTWQSHDGIPRCVQLAGRCQLQAVSSWRTRLLPMPQGKGFRREERDERPAPGCTASVSGSCAESLALNDFPNDGRDPQMGDGQVNGPTLGFWPERDDDLLDLRQAGRGREGNRNLVVAATRIGEVAEDLGRDQAGSGRGAAYRFQGDDGLVDRHGRAIAKGQHTA